MVWVGGQLLLSLLVLPVLRRRLDTASRAPLTREVGVRFGIFIHRRGLPAAADRDRDRAGHPPRRDHP
jgi:hypothetical protein